MDNTVYRQAAIDAVRAFYDEYTVYDNGKSIEDLISELPSAQPDCSDCIKHGGDWDCDHVHCHKGESAQLERKKGKWIEVDNSNNTISGRCSLCGWEAHLYEDDVVGMNYCPNCGAKMEEDDE